MKNIRYLLVILAALAITACSEDKDKPKPEASSDKFLHWMQNGPVAQNRILRVVNQNGEALAQAEILIGESMNRPFTNNFIQTEEDGSFIAPPEWQNAEMVTVNAKGYLRATYLGQSPDGQTFTLRPSDSATKFQLSGKGVGFQVTNNDGQVDFGLMIPAMKKSDLFAFTVNSFISPINDKIEAAGQELLIPSNISLPDQKERYLFFNVNLNKPQYRLFFDSPGKKWVYTARGQFPFKKVADELRDNKPFYELVNFISLNGGSLRQIDITSTNTVADLPVNELQFTQTRAYRAPTFGKDDFVLAAAASEFQGVYFPTDVKNVDPGQTLNLRTAAGSAPYILTALSKKSETNLGDLRMSASFEAFAANKAPVLLPLIEKPRVQNQRTFSIRAISAPTGLTPKATYAALSSVKRTKNNQNVVTESTQRVWEVYSKGWLTDVKLPEWPGEVLQVNGLKRWEVALVAAGAEISVAIGPRFLDNVSHATRSQADFQ